MVKWLNKKDRARLKVEYHKGTVEARKAYIQEMFDRAVTYENFLEDWSEEIARTVANETDEEMKNVLTIRMRRVTPPEDYFWDLICRSIYTDQSYEGRISRDGEGNVVSVEDPDGHSPMSHYEYPLVWMCGHCKLLLNTNPDPQDYPTRFYGIPKEIPHNAKTRAHQAYRTARRAGKKGIAFLGVIYLLVRLYSELAPKLIS